MGPQSNPFAQLRKDRFRSCFRMDANDRLALLIAGPSFFSRRPEPQLLRANSRLCMIPIKESTRVFISDDSSRRPQSHLRRASGLAFRCRPRKRRAMRRVAVGGSFDPYANPGDVGIEWVNCRPRSAVDPVGAAASGLAGGYSDYKDFWYLRMHIMTRHSRLMITLDLCSKIRLRRSKSSGLSSSPVILLIRSKPLN